MHTYIPENVVMSLVWKVKTGGVAWSPRHRGPSIPRVHSEIRWTDEPVYCCITTTSALVSSLRQTFHANNATRGNKLNGRSRRVNRLTPMGPARRCLTPNRPSRCTHSCMSSAIDSRRSSSPADGTYHVYRVAVRCCQHQTDRCRCLYRTRRRSACCVAKFFVSPEFGTKFHRRVPLFLEIPHTHARAHTHKTAQPAMQRYRRYVTARRHFFVELMFQQISRK